MIHFGSGKKVDTLIVGTGIAGSTLAFELQKRNASYLICTAQKSPKANTSSLSFGHCRTPPQGELKQTVEKSVSFLGESRQRMKFVYSKANLVQSLFEELGIGFEQRAFGIIPKGGGRGGLAILRKLQREIPSIQTETRLVGLSKKQGVFQALLRKEGIVSKVRAKRVVLATGGFASRFPYSDTFKVQNNGLFKMVQGLGGHLANSHCLFLHPLAFNKGRQILIGKDLSRGEFLDNEGRFVFSNHTRQLLEADSYHESFNQLLLQSAACRQHGSQVYFVLGGRSIRIVPTAHYTAGGIKTDPLAGVLGCKGLFAVGECAADGSKNCGRLPGYPFTAAIVYGKVLGERLASPKPF